MSSWAPMVRTGSDPKFYTNQLRFATEAEALASANELMARWMMVVETRADLTDDPVTDVWNEATSHADRLATEPR